MPGPASLMPKNTPSDMGRHLADLQRQINELRAARTAEATTVGSGGLTLQGGGLTVRGADGGAIASIDTSGRMQTAGLTVSGSLNVNTGDYTGVGGALYDILDRRPRSGDGFGGQYSDAPSTNTSGGVGVFEIGINCYPNRLYKLCTSTLRVDGTSDCFCEVQIRYETSALGATPATPSISSPLLAQAPFNVGGVYSIGSTTVQKLFTTGLDRRRLLLCYARTGGAGTLTMRGNGGVIEMWVEDLGPYSANLQQTNNGGGGVMTAPPQRFTCTRDASWVQVIGSARGVRGDIGNNARQGYYNGTWGNNQSFIGFPDMTAEMAGGTVESVSLYMYANAWYANAGGEAVIGRHSYTAPPGGLGSSRVDDMVRSGGWPNPGDRWVDISAFNPQGWVNGSNQGIVLGSGSSADQPHYGTFNGPGMDNAPRLTIVYRR